MLLERNGFDYDLVEDLIGYVVQLSKTSKYAPILKNSVAFKETANERIFLMKDLAAVEEAVGLGAKIVDGEVAFCHLAIISFSFWIACIVLAASLFFTSSECGIISQHCQISNILNYTTVDNICGPIHIDLAKIFIIETSLFLKVV